MRKLLSSFWSWAPQPLRHAVAREGGSELFEIQIQTAFRVASATLLTGCKMCGGRRGSWGLHKTFGRHGAWIWRGSSNDAFRVTGTRCETLNHSVERLQILHQGNVTSCRHHVARQLQDFVYMPQVSFFVERKLLLKYPPSMEKRWKKNILQFWGQVCIADMSFSDKSRRKASFWSFQSPLFRKVSQTSFWFEPRSFMLEKSRRKASFWASKFHSWRTSRKKASFLKFEIPCLKEASQRNFFSIF